jgi:2-polyprenyl-3-methyl-5-hydroxy-6-metoxy-1,4-benzoquinol methylase
MLFTTIKKFFIEPINDMVNESIYKNLVSKEWFESHSIEAPNIIISHLIKVDKFKNLKDGNKLICDFGCGDGIMLTAFNELIGARGIGLDLHKVDVQKLKNTFNYFNKEFDENKLNFYSIDEYSSNQKFDFVMSWSVVEHVKNIDSYIRDMKNMLNEDGVAYVQTWPLWNSAFGHHLMGVVEPYEHLKYSDDEIFISNLEKYKSNFANNNQLSFESWKREATKSYYSCNKYTFDMIDQTLKKYFKVIFFKPYIDDIGFNLIELDIDYKNFLISGGHWILIHK